MRRACGSAACLAMRGLPGISGIADERCGVVGWSASAIFARAVLILGGPCPSEGLFGLVMGVFDVCGTARVGVREHRDRLNVCFLF